jgi:hypothetical protein
LRSWQESQSLESTNGIGTKRRRLISKLTDTSSIVYNWSSYSINGMLREKEVELS